MSSNRVITYHILKKFASLCDCNDSLYTDCFIVTTYLRQNNIQVQRNRLLLEHIIADEKIDLFIKYLDNKKIKLSLEDLIVFFEFVISPEDKEVNGAVYTPEYIRESIVSRILNQLEGELGEKKYADIACGCGGFLITLAMLLHKKSIPYRHIFSDCLYGVDIAEYSIIRTRLMLTLLALEEEDEVDYHFNLIQANSLNFDWKSVYEVKEHGGFDAIVSNPPYVGASKIDETSLELVKKWEVSQSGKADMYIPFFQIGLENLVPNGFLGYITVNNFYRSVNGRALRQYISQRGYDVHIIDFGAEQIFQGRSTYTCLCFVQIVPNGVIHYVSSDSQQLGQITERDYVRYAYQQLTDKDAWILTSDIELPVIKRIRETGMPLGEYATIRNGIATLRNELYLFTPKREDEQHYYFDTTYGEQRIEKSICRDAIKGNILRTQDDLDKFSEKLIYPYKMDATGTNVVIILEEELHAEYPYAYQYFETVRAELGKRSNSDKIQPWYAYGRSQALNNRGYKLIFPYIADRPYFILCENSGMMFYNGYAIIDDSLEKLRFLQKLLNSKVFWYYIQKTSKPYGGDFYALAKNYVKTFGVAEFSDEEKIEVIMLSQKDADSLFMR